MRQTYSSILAQHLRNINLVGSTDTSIIADFKYHLGTRYQLALAKLRNYKTVYSASFTTVASQQSYALPLGSVTVEGMYITIGSVNYPLRSLMSRWNDEQLNAIQIQASAVPQFFFVEGDSFKIWPIPQDAYSGVIYYHYRDRNLGIDDFTGGTVTLTNGSNILANDTALFTPAMVGRWFTVTDPTVVGQGYWYRITGYTDTTHLTFGTATGIDVTWSNTTASTSSYNIAESPDIPEDLHEIFAFGTTADYYGGMRKDPKNFAFYDNIFWTGDPTNKSRVAGDKETLGGLIGGISNYSDRDDRRLIKRKPKLNPLQYKVFATTLS